MRSGAVIYALAAIRAKHKQHFVPNIYQPTAADKENGHEGHCRYLLVQPVKLLAQVISNSYGDEEDVSSSTNPADPRP